MNDFEYMVFIIKENDFLNIERTQKPEIALLRAINLTKMTQACAS